MPLSPGALAILSVMAAKRRNDWIFAGQARGRPISAGALEMLLRRLDMKSLMTVHRDKKPFRDWAGDATTFPREVIEQALAHRVGDSTPSSPTGAPMHSTERRKLMDAWDRYCSTSSAPKVVAFHGRAEQPPPTGEQMIDALRAHYCGVYARSGDIGSLQRHVSKMLRRDCGPDETSPAGRNHRRDGASFRAS